MTPTPIALLEKAAELDLKLGRKGRDTLTVEPAERCPPAFADTLKDIIADNLSRAGSSWDCVQAWI
jgi:hypothetical protein